MQRSSHTPGANALKAVTIITAVFNGKDHLLDTINSIKALNSPYVRYVIIDGGSQDGTLEIIKDNESFIDYWHSEKDAGIYDAFNKGWQMADPNSHVLYLGVGDRILSLPSIDVINSADVIYGNVIMSDNVTFRSKLDFRSRLGNTIHHQAMLVRRKLFQNPPFDVRFKRYADFDVTQRLLKMQATFLYDHGFVSYALPGGITQEFNMAESAAIVKKNFGLLHMILARCYYSLQDLMSWTKKSVRR